MYTTLFALTARSGGSAGIGLIGAVFLISYVLGVVCSENRSYWKAVRLTMIIMSLLSLPLLFDFGSWVIVLIVMIFGSLCGPMKIHEKLFRERH